MKFRAWKNGEMTQITQADPVRLVMTITRRGNLYWEIKGKMQDTILADGCVDGCEQSGEWNLEVDFE